MEPGQEPAARVCQKHGLVPDPQGLCVLCRREAAGGEEETSTRGLPLLVLLVLLVGLSGGLVYKAAIAVRPAPVVVPSGTAAPAPSAADPIEDLAEAQAAARARDRERESQREREDFDKRMRDLEVRIFVTKSCDLCRTAVDFMTQKGIKHVAVDVEATPEDLEALRKANPKLSVPTIIVGDEVILGYGPATLQAAVYRAAMKPPQR